MSGKQNVNSIRGLFGKDKKKNRKQSQKKNKQKNKQTNKQKKQTKKQTKKPEKSHKFAQYETPQRQNHRDNQHTAIPNDTFDSLPICDSKRTFFFLLNKHNIFLHGEGVAFRFL